MSQPFDLAELELTFGLTEDMVLRSVETLGRHADCGGRVLFAPQSINWDRISCQTCHHDRRVPRLVNPTMRAIRAICADYPESAPP